MKINKAKLLVGTLAIASVAATVGSISGTVAWFQYSTRSTVAYQGAAAHCSENLQIRIDSTGYEWGQDLSAKNIKDYLTAAVANNGAGRSDVNLRPVTSSALALNAVPGDLYKNPIYQYADPSSWGKGSATLDYIVIPLELRVLDVDGSNNPASLAKNIYITDIAMEARADHENPDYTAADHLDLSSALRLGVTAGSVRNSQTAGEWNQFATFSKAGSPVDVYGALDLNGDGEDDLEAGYEWEDLDEVVYGEENAQAISTPIEQIAANADATTQALHRVANDEKADDIKGTPIGATTATSTLKVELKIYLEGWTLFDAETVTGETTYQDKTVAELVEIKNAAQPGQFDLNKNYKLSDGKFYKWNATAEEFQVVNPKQSAIWDATKAVGAEFNLGIRFSAEAHADHQ